MKAIKEFSFTVWTYDKHGRPYDSGGCIVGSTVRATSESKARRALLDKCHDSDKFIAHIARMAT